MTRKKVENTSDIISAEDVFNVLTFAQNAYGGQINGIYTPFLVNQKLQEITMSPQVATSAKIDAALTDPKNNEQQLIGYTEWLELNSMMFKRILSYFSGLMSFDWNYVCTNAKPEEYNTPAYKKDLDIIKDFTDKFNIKQEFRISMKEMMRTETFFGVLRDDGNKYILQELPQDYCKIVGRFDYGLLYDYDMRWFLTPAVSLDMYPRIFTKMFNDVFYKGGKLQYDPAAYLNSRDGVFALWHQTSPDDGFVCFKISPELGTRVPFLSPLMPNVVLEPVIRGLQTNSYIQQASKILFGEVPMLKDAQAKLKDQISISSDTLGKFLSLVQSAIPSAIKIAAAPLNNTSAIEFKGSDTIYSSFIQNTAASSGTNSRLLYSIDRQNVLETKLSMDIDQNILRPIYHQFENFLEFVLNKRTKKFKFKIIFEGFETSLNREERLNTANTLAEKGIVLEQKYASALGLSPFDFRRMLEESKANGFVEKLTPIVNASQMSGDTKTGRPQEDEDDLSDGGSDTRASGTNISRGGRV